jgi:DNA-binding transcriptional ArsR family regulator
MTGAPSDIDPHDEATAQVTLVSDPAVMRALAHPARLAVLDVLMAGNSATATECAEVVGLSPSAMSYHLRALAKTGLIEEAPSEGDARERRWRRASAGLNVDAGPDASPEAVTAELALLDAFLVRQDSQVREWMRHRRAEPADWESASSLSETWLWLTREELTEITDLINSTLRPFTERVRRQPPEGSRRVVVQFRAFPMEKGLRDKM